MTIRGAALILADGSIFEGEAIGAEPAGGITGGEVVFNTVLTGYQEVITDPSYAGQIITFTYPHIGNYGVNPADNESEQAFCRGIVVRDLARRPSNWRSTESLDAFLARAGVAGIAGVDTRALTRHIRDAGAMPGAFGTTTESVLKQAAADEPGTDGFDLVDVVTTKSAYSVAAAPSAGTRRIVAMDLGIKRTIVAHLSKLGSVEVVPASTTSDDIMAHEPDGVFLSNGPGDPASVAHVTDTINELLGKVPVFGICLGHQMLARAVGGETTKMAFGHHGGNHPVKNLLTGRIEITSQNHNFAVLADTLDSNVELTHVNLNDGVCEGIRLTDVPAFSVQHHPEASPGPHDSAYLFEDFAQLMQAGR